MDELNEIAHYLLRSSPDAMIVIDECGRIRFANETVTQLFGYPPASLNGQSIDVLVPERFRARHGKHIAGFAANPNNREMGARIADLFALRADGSEFSAGIRLAPFRIGGKLFIAAAIRDMTERRIVNDELVAAREEAVRANRAKSRFLATASHDLRQPMQTVRLLNAAMLKVVPEPEIRELLQHQGHAIESMARLLNALLDISRLESGAIEPLNANVALGEVFDELRSEFESVAQTRDIQLQVDRPSSVVSTDRTLLAQLLQNLLGNALKYTDRGSVTLKCVTDSEGIAITVQDTGIGIPADKLERIFDEYYQVDTHGTKRMGVGLGLAIVKEVTKLLGFSIRIASEVGQGTQATVRIPGQFVLAQMSPPAPAVAQETIRPAGKARLILVEDNDGVRIATETFLKFEGHEVASAPTIADAEKLFASLGESDIVIADYHLDSKNTGLDMLTRLRASVGYAVPGVVLSGDLPAVLRSIKSPIENCRFLSKPVDINALVEAIAELSAGPVARERRAASIAG